MFNKNTKKITLLLLIVVLAIGAVGCSNNGGKGNSVSVAKVNGKGVSFDDFKDEYNAYKTLYSSQFGEDALLEKNQTGGIIAETLRDDILDKVILEEIVRQEAEKKNLKIEDDEVKESYDEIIESLGGKEQYSEFLIKSGFTDDYFKKNIKNELLFFKYRENFEKENPVDQEESKDYYEENKENLIVAKASHILVNSEEDGKEILEKLKAGEDFKTLAKENSLDTASGAMGGDLGYFGKGDMIAEFDQAVFSMKKGETSDLVKTDVGYHIIYLEDIKETYEDLKDEIDYMIIEEKFAKHLSELRENAKVEIDEEVLESLDLGVKENLEENTEENTEENKENVEENKKEDKEDNKDSDNDKKEN